MCMLSVIDYLCFFIEFCLWVFDVNQCILLFKEWVVYGCNSGDNFIECFFNVLGSLMFSFGIFVIDGIYQGYNGYLLWLKGLDDGFNDNVESCVIVIYGVSYVSLVFVKMQGWIGCSWGCLVVCVGVVYKLIDVICECLVVFVYYLNQCWLSYVVILGDCGISVIVSFNGGGG